MKNYFAYGSNMNTAQVKERCSDHKVVGTGSLDGFRFIINSRGVATVIPMENRSVLGVIYEISESDEANLDANEGVDYGTYLKEQVHVQTGNEIRDCLIYIAADSELGRPRPGYLQKILGGAEAFNLAGEYIEELRSWQKPD